MKLQINGLMKDEDILWKKIACKCDKSNVELSFPLIDCINCRCQKQEDSMPRNQFKIKLPVLDKNGLPTGKTTTKDITEITITRGEKLNEIVGWGY